MSPNTYSIDKIPLNVGGHICLVQNNSKDQLATQATQKILELIVKRLSGYFIGAKHFLPPIIPLPEGVVCFKLNKGTTVRRNIYITVFE